MTGRRPPHSGQADRLVEIESLRGVAASSILLFHCWLFSSAAVFTWNVGPLTPFMQPLQSGVTLFFVLSGFLLYRPVARAVLSGTAPPPVSSYLRNRALRVLPAYWFVLLVSGFALQSATATVVSGRGVVAGALTDPRVLGSDLLLVQTYDPSTIWTGILPTWSLTVELAFYLVLPLLALMAGALARSHDRVSRSAAAFAAVAAMFVLGFIGKLVVAIASDGPARAGAADWHTVFDRSFLTHADLFGFGMAAAFLLVLWERRPDGPPRFISNGVTGRVLAYCGVPTLVLGFYVIHPYAYDSLVALFSAIALLRLLSPHRVQRRTSVLRHRWAIAWGRVSYSVFLWNFPVLIFLRLHGVLASGHGATDFLFNLVIATVAVGALSFFTYRFIEAPALALKRHRSARTQAAAPAQVPA